ncbi:MAG: hypothetical protein K8U03_10875 [Planctomycetia bacterium]|nr:hypothetical protein [Planctomycetia bacterium]
MQRLIELREPSRGIVVDRMPGDLGRDEILDSKLERLGVLDRHLAEADTLPLLPADLELNRATVVLFARDACHSFES